MYKPSTYLVVTYFPTYLPVSETYFFQNWLPTWNQRLTQLRFIHNWVIVGIQWRVHWTVLVHCGPRIVGTWLTNHCGKLWDRNTWESISCSHTIHPAWCPGRCLVGQEAGVLRLWRYNKTWIHCYVLTSILCTYYIVQSSSQRFQNPFLLVSSKFKAACSFVRKDLQKGREAAAPSNIKEIQESVPLLEHLHRSTRNWPARMANGNWGPNRGYWQSCP
jgi:hypothetical protein